jgi:hypothetical protein
VTLKPDFVPSSLAMAAGRDLAHGSPSFVACLDRKLEGNVMSEHHQMW